MRRAAFPNLFRPITVGRYTLANRIMNTGHAAHFQTGDGLPTQAYVDYVRERARGGGAVGWRNTIISTDCPFLKGRPVSKTSPSFVMTCFTCTASISEPPDVSRGSA